MTLLIWWVAICIPAVVISVRLLRRHADRADPLPSACPARAEVTVRTCRSCGCTDAAACPGGCSWVEHDLCSACVEWLDAAAQLAARPRPALRLVRPPLPARLDPRARLTPGPATRRRIRRVLPGAGRSLSAAAAGGAR